MRYYIITAIFIFLYATGSSQKENQQITSKIEKVTMFLQGAQVERSARQALTTGKYNVVFSGISPKVEKQSIQLKAEGKLTVLSVTHQVNFLKEQELQEDTKQVESQKEQLNQKLTLEKNIRNVFVQEEQMILKNQSIKGDATLKAADLKEAADFQRQRLTEVYQRLQETDRNIKRIETDIHKLNKQLVELNQKRDLSTSEVIVAVDVKEAMSANFHLTYLVKQSSWHPSYDVRVVDIIKPINLQMKANVNQQSGEDWKEVKLFLSTGNPDENGTKPNLSPWYLRYYYPPVAPSQIKIRGISEALEGKAAGVAIGNRISGIVRAEDGTPMVGTAIVIKGTNTGTVTDANGNFTIPAPPGFNTLLVSSVGYAQQEIFANGGFVNIKMKVDEHHLEEVVVTAYGNSNSYDYDDSDIREKKRVKKDETAINTTTIYQPTTTIFEIENPYTVPSDGKMYTVDINNYELNALYEYYSVPKLDQSAYLTAKITDWQELNLLPGEANLFFEGTYLGNSILDVKNAGDTLNISLGQDKAVIVKRTLMKEYSSKKFLGSNKTDTRQYAILVRNNKQQPITIIVEDQFPVSTTKEIEVDKLSYENGRLDDDTKKVTWSLVVDPKKENKIQLGYSVKYPKDKILQLD
jgi:hypothetical protein